MSNWKRLEQITKAAHKLGYQTDYHRAGTGTIYLTCILMNDDNSETTIRIADHGDAYGSADYTCDGLEGTPEGAKKHLAEFAAAHSDDEHKKYVAAYKAWSAHKRYCKKVGMNWNDATRAESMRLAKVAEAICDSRELPREWNL